jgi:predicted peptidase
MALKRKCLFILSFILLAIGFNNIDAQPSAKKEVKYKYLLYKPQNYDSVQESFPLVIYLHGSSRRGSDINKIKTYGLPFYVAHGHQYPFIIASPQCPAGKSWVTSNWFGPLYKELREKYRIDTTRIYVMGMSLGGYGTWHVALDYPDMFAAMVPICGGCLDSLDICEIRNIPIWAFHGKKDNRVAFRETEKLVQRLRECGAPIKFTALENKGHNLAYVFNDPEVLTWMLAQRKLDFYQPGNPLDTLKWIQPKLPLLTNNLFDKYEEIELCE